MDLPAVSHAVSYLLQRRIFPGEIEVHDKRGKVFSATSVSVGVVDKYSHRPACHRDISLRLSRLCLNPSVTSVICLIPA